MIVNDDDARRGLGDGRAKDLPGCTSELLSNPLVTRMARSTWLWLSRARR